MRLWRWRLWALRGRADLVCLASGYGWLALGLALYGAAALARRHETVALHFITVGALGTLTFNVMALASLVKARRDPAGCTALVWGTALIAAAALARAARQYEAAALCWSAAFALLAFLLAANWQWPRRRGGRPSKRQGFPSPLERRCRAALYLYRTRQLAPATHRGESPCLQER